MNYRHAFHAGSFADVVKHAVLVRILLHLGTKPAAFRVIDTHAGAGLYDLAGPEASRSLEWREGIHRLFTTTVAEPARAALASETSGQRGHHEVRAHSASEDARKRADDTRPEAGSSARVLLARYLAIVAELNPSGRLEAYPGSPAIVRALLRPQDRLIACELEPNAAAALGRYLAGDRRAKALAIDGWTALNAYVPPKERRGLVLIDPPFEEEADFARLARSLEAAHRKWPGGTYLLWYPIKDRDAPDTLARRLRRSGIAKILRAELGVAAPCAPSRLGACGLIVVNPPWTLERELDVMLPALAAALSGDRARHCVDWLVGEK
jgi:23S rRNA (adenine2030-N6)-methyltransferase